MSCRVYHQRGSAQGEDFDRATKRRRNDGPNGDGGTRRRRNRKRPREREKKGRRSITSAAILLCSRDLKGLHISGRDFYFSPPPPPPRGRPSIEKHSGSIKRTMPSSSALNGFSCEASSPPSPAVPVPISRPLGAALYRSLPAVIESRAQCFRTSEPKVRDQQQIERRILRV